MDAESLSFARELKGRGVRLLYDIDDHILAFPPYSITRTTTENIENIYQFLEISDVVTGANDHIVRLYTQHCPHIALLPNGIYVERYRQAAESGPRGDEICIGMVNADFLKIVSFKSDWLEAIDSLRRRYSGLRFMYYGDFSPVTLGMDNWEWLGTLAFDDYRRSLFSGVFDIGVTPLGGLEDEESLQFNLCKSPIKFLEFGAASIVGVYSDMPVYRSVIEDGKNGLLAKNTAQSWIERLSLLIEEPATRARLGQEAYQQVIDKLHARFSSAILLKMLNGSS